MANNIFIGFIILAGVIGYFLFKPLIIVAGLVLLSYYYYDRQIKSKENYGGPIKNVRKIPITTCYKICDNWAYHCERDRPGNYGGCATQRNACRSECYYSNSQRM